MAEEIRIEIPLFVQEMKLAESKSKTYYKQFDEIPERYRKKMEGSNPEYAMHKGVLCRVVPGKRKPKYVKVVKNVSSFGKPRWKSIAGNDIWGRVHPRIRMAMIDAIHENFKPYMPKVIPLKFPIQIDMEVHTPCRHCDWDIGNLWVYDKVFQDMLTPKYNDKREVIEKGLIPDDNILYVTKAGGPRFIPVVGDSNRKIVFILREETDPRILSHVMYDLQNFKQPNIYTTEGEVEHARIRATHDWYTITPVSSGEAGTIMTDNDQKIIWVSVGKTKISHAACKRGFARAFSTIVQLNAHVHVSLATFNNYRNYVRQEFMERGLTIHVYG